MKLSAVALLAALQSTAAFAPHGRPSKATFLQGYLDDLSKDLYGEDPNPNPEEESREATAMNKEDVANFGVGNWDSYVEFDEFDGGDGQMGVAGDGNKSLEKFDMSEIANQSSKSRMRSAKNAWGSSSGYADSLIDKGVDTQRAQQLENWHSQQEVSRQRAQARAMTEQYDNASDPDEDWRKLASFGVERNQDFDFESEFGAVTVGDIEGTIELTARMYGPASVYEFPLRNEYMGFADFRAEFTADTGAGWTIEPTEGSLMQREDTNFIARFKPQAPGVAEGYLVIETEDFKKTWKVIGNTA